MLSLMTKKKEQFVDSLGENGNSIVSHTMEDNKEAIAKCSEIFWKDESKMLVYLGHFLLQKKATEGPIYNWRGVHVKTK